MFAFTKFSLARQFMLVSFLILLTGMLIIGLWVGKQIEIGVTNRTAAVTSLYVDSFVSPYLQDLSRTGNLESRQLAALNRLLTETPLGKRIVAFKVWTPDGHILYSPNPNLIGQQYVLQDDLEKAFAGEVSSKISNLKQPENEYERLIWDTLIETYAPIWAKGGGEVIAVSEFYQTPDDLQAEILAAQLRSWLVVGLATLAMYLLLAGMVGRASNIILAQQTDLRDNVAQLHTLLAQNKELHGRVRRAAARTTTLNERFLRRISADLHDGPGQDLALALMRLESLCNGDEGQATPFAAEANEFPLVHDILASALKDLRAIAAGLRLPELNELSPAEVARRATHDYKHKTGQTVTLIVDGAPEAASMPVKIALYRVLQEALANGFRHTGGVGQTVKVWGEDGRLHAEVADTGTGFDLRSVSHDGHLGLAGMRERVELLGGTFSVETASGQGTRVSAVIPLEKVETIE